MEDNIISNEQVLNFKEAEEGVVTPETLPPIPPNAEQTRDLNDLLENIVSRASLAFAGDELSVRHPENTTISNSSNASYRKNDNHAQTDTARITHLESQVNTLFTELQNERAIAQHQRDLLTQQCKETTSLRKQIIQLSDSLEESERDVKHIKAWKTQLPERESRLQKIMTSMEQRESQITSSFVTKRFFGNKLETVKGDIYDNVRREFNIIVSKIEERLKNSISKVESVDGTILQTKANIENNSNNSNNTDKEFVFVTQNVLRKSLDEMDQKLNTIVNKHCIPIVEKLDNFKSVTKKLRDEDLDQQNRKNKLFEERVVNLSGAQAKSDVTHTSAHSNARSAVEVNSKELKDLREQLRFMRNSLDGITMKIQSVSLVASDSSNKIERLEVIPTELRKAAINSEASAVALRQKEVSVERERCNTIERRLADGLIAVHEGIHKNRERIVDCLVDRINRKKSPMHKNKTNSLISSTESNNNEDFKEKNMNSLTPAVDDDPDENNQIERNVIVSNLQNVHTHELKDLREIVDNMSGKVSKCLGCSERAMSNSQTALSDSKEALDRVQAAEVSIAAFHSEYITSLEVEKMSKSQIESKLCDQDIDIKSLSRKCTRLDEAVLNDHEIVSGIHRHVEMSIKTAVSAMGLHLQKKNINYNDLLKKVPASSSTKLIKTDHVGSNKVDELNEDLLKSETFETRQKKQRSESLEVRLSHADDLIKQLKIHQNSIHYDDDSNIKEGSSYHDKHIHLESEQEVAIRASLKADVSKLESELEKESAKVAETSSIRLRLSELESNLKEEMRASESSKRKHQDAMNMINAKIASSKDLESELEASKESMKAAMEVANIRAANAMKKVLDYEAESREQAKKYELKLSVAETTSARFLHEYKMQKLAREQETNMIKLSSRAEYLSRGNAGNEKVTETKNIRGHKRNNSNVSLGESVASHSTNATVFESSTPMKLPSTPGYFVSNTQVGAPRGDQRLVLGENELSVVGSSKIKEKRVLKKSGVKPSGPDDEVTRLRLSEKRVTKTTNKYKIKQQKEPALTHDVQPDENEPIEFRQCPSCLKRVQLIKLRYHLDSECVVALALARRRRSETLQEKESTKQISAEKIGVHGDPSSRGEEAYKDKKISKQPPKIPPSPPPNKFVEAGKRRQKERERESKRQQSSSNTTLPGKTTDSAKVSIDTNSSKIDKHAKVIADVECKHCDSTYPVSNISFHESHCSMRGEHITSEEISRHQDDCDGDISHVRKKKKKKKKKSKHLSNENNNTETVTKEIEVDDIQNSSIYHEDTPDEFQSSRSPSGITRSLSQQSIDSIPESLVHAVEGRDSESPLRDSLAFPFGKPTQIAQTNPQKNKRLNRTESPADIISSIRSQDSSERKKKIQFDPFKAQYGVHNKTDRFNSSGIPEEDSHEEEDTHEDSTHFENIPIDRTSKQYHGPSMLLDRMDLGEGGTSSVIDTGSYVGSDRIYDYDINPEMSESGNMRETLTQSEDNLKSSTLEGSASFISEIHEESYRKSSNVEGPASKQLKYANSRISEILEIGDLRESMDTADESVFESAREVTPDIDDGGARKRGPEKLENAKQVLPRKASGRKLCDSIEDTLSYSSTALLDASVVDDVSDAMSKTIDSSLINIEEKLEGASLNNSEKSQSYIDHNLSLEEELGSSNNSSMTRSKGRRRKEIDRHAESRESRKKKKKKKKSSTKRSRKQKEDLSSASSLKSSITYNYEHPSSRLSSISPTSIPESKRNSKNTTGGRVTLFPIQDSRQEHSALRNSNLHAAAQAAAAAVNAIGNVDDYKNTSNEYQKEGKDGGDIEGESKTKDVRHNASAKTSGSGTNAVSKKISRNKPQKKKRKKKLVPPKVPGIQRNKTSPNHKNIFFENKTSNENSISKDKETENKTGRISEILRTSPKNKIVSLVTRLTKFESVGDDGGIVALLPVDIHSIHDWGLQRISAWLVEIGMDELITPFKDLELNGEDLLEISEEDLSDHLPIRDQAKRSAFLQLIKYLKDFSGVGDGSTSSRGTPAPTPSSFLTGQTGAQLASVRSAFGRGGRGFNLGESAPAGSPSLSLVPTPVSTDSTVARHTSSSRKNIIEKYEMPVRRVKRSNIFPTVKESKRNGLHIAPVSTRQSIETKRNSPLGTRSGSRSPSERISTNAVSFPPPKSPKSTTTRKTFIRDSNLEQSDGSSSHFLDSDGSLHESANSKLKVSETKNALGENVKSSHEEKESSDSHASRGIARIGVSSRLRQQARMIANAGDDEIESLEESFNSVLDDSVGWDSRRLDNKDVNTSNNPTSPKYVAEHTGVMGSNNNRHKETRREKDPLSPSSWGSGEHSDRNLSRHHNTGINIGITGRGRTKRKLNPMLDSVDSLGSLDGSLGSLDGSLGSLEALGKGSLSQSHDFLSSGNSNIMTPLRASPTGGSYREMGNSFSSDGGDAETSRRSLHPVKTRSQSLVDSPSHQSFLMAVSPAPSKLSPSSTPPSPIALHKDVSEGKKSNSK